MAEDLTSITPRRPEAPRVAGPSALTLPVLLSGTFMTFLDFFIINVAVPDIQRSLDAGSGTVLLVVAGYGLTYASGVITGSRLGDIHGRRNVFAVGMALFTLASLFCGVAPNAISLVAARMLQGLAAALLFPQVLATVGAVFRGAARSRAIVAYGMTLGVAAVGGQLVGGALIEADPGGLGWRACFLANVPVGIAALLLVRRAVPESRADHASRLDLPGAALATAGLLALILPLAEGREQGWPPWTWLSLGASAVLLGLFLLHQRLLGRRNGTPLADLRLFRERAYATGVAAVFVFYAGLASYFLVIALYLQQGHGLGPLASGIRVVPMGVGFFVTTLLARSLAQRLGRQLPALGGLVLAGGLVWTAYTIDDLGGTGGTAELVAPFLLDGIGMGMVTTPLVTVVLASVAPAHAGQAAGMLSTMQQVGNAVGVAVVGVVFYSALESGGRPDFPHAFVTSAYYLVAMHLLLALLLQFLPRPAKAAART